MKRIQIASIVILVVVALVAIAFWLVPLPATDRDLQLSLDYHPDKDAFVVQLRNRAPHRIRATVNEADYYGSIWIVDSNGEKKEYFIEQYRLILLTGITGVPVITLNPRGETGILAITAQIVLYQGHGSLRVLDFGSPCG